MVEVPHCLRVCCGCAASARGTLHKESENVDTNGRSGLGPGFADVSEYLILLSREWGGTFKYGVSADRDRRGNARLFVVLERRPAFSDDGSGGTQRVWSPYPNPTSGTFAATLFRLCYELESKLTRLKLERERQASF